MSEAGHRQFRERVHQKAAQLPNLKPKREPERSERLQAMLEAEIVRADEFYRARHPSSQPPPQKVAGMPS